MLRSENLGSWILLTIEEENTGIARRLWEHFQCQPSSNLMVLLQFGLSAQVLLNSEVRGMGGPRTGTPLSPV